MEKRKQEIRAELDQIKNRAKNAKKPGNNKGLNRIEASLRDKSVRTQDQFPNEGVGSKKTAGMSKGYIAQEAGTGETFILKSFLKKQPVLGEVSFMDLDRIDEYSRNKDDRRDGIQEFISSTMYQFLLYDRAPKEQLVTIKANDPAKANNSDLLYIRSKFFKDAKQLSVFSGGDEGGPLGHNSEEITGVKNLEGFEKVIAACHILGEADYHAGNMMVQSGKITKIDHGRSFWDCQKDFASMIESTHNKFKEFGFDQEIGNGNLVFDVQKYSSSLNQMLSQFTEDQIEVIVDRRVDELRAAGFDPKGMEINPVFGPDDVRKHKFEGFEDLRETYKQIAKENLKNMRKIAGQVEIIARFSGVEDNFKKGGWLKKFAETSDKDPIGFAINKKIAISGMDSIEYAIKNNVKVEREYIKPYKEEVIKDYIAARDPKAKKTLQDKYSTLNKIEKGSAKLLSMESNLGKILSKPQAAQILLNHPAFKDKAPLEGIDYTNCDLELVKKCKEIQGQVNQLQKEQTAKTNFKANKFGNSIRNIVANYEARAQNPINQPGIELIVGMTLIKGAQEELTSLKKSKKQEVEQEPAQVKNNSNKRLKKLASLAASISHGLIAATTIDSSSIQERNSSKSSAIQKKRESSASSVANSTKNSKASHSR